LKRFAILIVFVCAILCVSSCAKQPEKKLYTIGIVQITEDREMDKARLAVIDALKEGGFVEGRNIRIIYNNAQGEMGNISLILKKYVADKVDLIITAGTPCMATAAHLVKDIPVVFTVSFSPLQLKMQAVPVNMTGAYDPLHMADFVELIKEIVPRVKRVGALYNPSEPNAVMAAESMKTELMKRQIELVLLSVSSSNDVLQAAQTLAAKNVDAFAVSADNTVYLALNAFAKAAGEHKIPLIVAEPSQINDGACAGMGIDYTEWGKASGRIARQIATGKKPAEIPVQALTNKVLYLNKGAARAQGVVFSPELLKGAAKVIE
jgi:putative tryptophan/tyrosine transport system substrate-binding protein